MINREQLFAEAVCIRQDFESRQLPRNLLGDLYVAYNPNVEIENFLKVAAELFPRLNCGLTAVYARHRLKEGVIIAGSFNGSRHTFLQVGELVVDITADQFGGPSVYVGRLRAPWSA